MHLVYRWDRPHPLFAEQSPPVRGRRCILAAIMRNEGPYVIEWAAYHYALGFREILVFPNFCDDLSDVILERLDDLGIVRHRPHPINALPAVGQVQIAGLRYAHTFAQFSASDYCMMIDADEYLEVFVGEHDLASFFEETEEFEVASFLVRGRNSDRKAFIGNGRVLPRFQHVTWEKPDQETSRAEFSVAVKSLARSKLEKGFHRNHRPNICGFSNLNKRWIDGGGHEFDASFTDRRVSKVLVPNHAQKAVVNHYAIRSAESFLVKAMRGDAASATRLGIDQKAVRNTISYWKTRDKTVEGVLEEPNTPPLFEALYEELMADPILAEMQEESLHIHRQKATEVVQTEYGHLIAEAIGFPHN